MIALRNLTWPRFVDIRRRKPPFESTLHARSTSLPDHTLHINSKSPRIETFDGPARSVSISKRQAIPAIAPCCAELESCSPDFVGSIRLSDAMSEHLTTSQEDALSRTRAQLPTPPDDSGEDIGLDINPHHPRDPSICSVCGLDQERYEDLPPLPDSPLAIAQFGFLSRESFNTSVRGLVQAEPDMPIGGYPATPMEKDVTLGTVLERSNFDGGRGSGASLQRIMVASTEHGSCCDEAHQRPRLIRRSTFTDPFIDDLKNKQARRKTDEEDSGYTTAMVTALETPVRRDNTDMSHDGAPTSVTEINNENIGSIVPLPGCCLSPTNTDDLESIGAYGPPGAGGKLYALEGRFGAARPGNVPENGFGVGGVERTDFAVPGGLGAPKMSRPGLSIPSIRVPAVPVIGLDGIVPLGTGLPIDATGTLPVPNTPAKVGKKQRVANKGKKGIRKCRRVLLRKPILALVLGRQLAGPTKMVLKLISSGVPVEPDVQGLSEAVGIPAPVPAPPSIPAPIPAPM